MKNLKYYFLMVIASLVMVSCDDDDDDEKEVLNPPIENEEEIITSFTIVFTPDSAGDVKTFNFLDTDGDGPINPIITKDTLEPNTNYTASVQLLNTLENPPEDITVEVKQEDKDHQLFYQTDVAGMTIQYFDQDADGNPVGLITRVETTVAGSGNLNIILRHEPDKNASGVSDGNIANAGGETDIEVDFTVLVQ